MNASSDRMRPDIYERGETVAVVHSVESETIEAWVRAVRGWSEVPDVDWHYFGGRARVAALGSAEDIEKVRKACAALLPSLHIILPELYPTVYGGEPGQVVCFQGEFKQNPIAGVVLPPEEYKKARQEASVLGFVRAYGKEDDKSPYVPQGCHIDSDGNVRTPDGSINNCLLANTGNEVDPNYGPCQICGGTCPDRQRITY